MAITKVEERFALHAITLVLLVQELAAIIASFANPEEPFLHFLVHAVLERMTLQAVVLLVHSHAKHAT